MDEFKKHFPNIEDNFVTNFNEYLKLIPNSSQFDRNDIALLYKALYKADYLHKNSKPRKTGEPYITHPIAVSSILVKYGLDAETCAAALLHDTVEDTPYTLEECEKDFGTVIATLVDGVTKVGHDVNRETHEKIIRSITKDVRSLAIKGGDRFHNMSTLGSMKREKQIEIANETNTFYVPALKILGIYKLKDGLQDLSFYYLHPNEFLKFEKKRNKLKQKYTETCNLFGDEVLEKLSHIGIGMYFKSRIKNIGAMYEEALKEGNVNNINDLLAIKMVVKDLSDCYLTLGVVNKIGKFVGGKTIDYIASPKDNGYKSLNTNVRYKDANIQVRIRTEDMQRTNDLGVFSDLNSAVQEKVTTKMKIGLNKLKKEGEQGFEKI